MAIPNPPEGWLWWVFSVIFVGTIVGIASNLASNRLQKYVDNLSEQRRTKRLEDNKFEALYVEEMVKRAESDPSVLTAMAYLVDYHSKQADTMMLLN